MTHSFYWNASCGSSHDLLYFGSVGGLVAIESNRPAMSLPAAKVRFTRLRIGNEEILPGSEYLSEDIAITTELKLHEKEKSFSLEFAALNLSQTIQPYTVIGWSVLTINGYRFRATDVLPVIRICLPVHILYKSDTLLTAKTREKT